MRKIYLFVLMAVGLLISGNVRAEGEQAQIGSTKYATLTEAIAAVPDGVETTIQMIADDVIDEALSRGSIIYTISSPKNIVLDLNGHRIYRYLPVLENASIFSVNGKLTVTDNSVTQEGEICLKTENGQGYGVGRYCINDYGEVVINAGHIFLDSKDISGCAVFAINVQKNGNLTINGGVLTNTMCAVIRLQGSNVFEMNGGLIEGTNGLWCEGKDVKASFNDGEYRCIADDAEKPRFAFQADADAKGTYNITINGGSFNRYFDFVGKTSGEIKVTGGNFTYHNAFRNVSTDKFITGGTFYFSTSMTNPTMVVSNYVRFVIKDGQPICENYDTFGKFTGDLGTKEGWEALGYIVVEETLPDGDPKESEGPWYHIIKYTTADEDYEDFLKLIADGYIALDITGQDDGKGGKWPEKTVIVTKITEKKMSGNDTWTASETDGASAVVLEEGANITIPANTTVEAYSVEVPAGTILNVENGSTLIVGAGGVTTVKKPEAICINIGSAEGSGAIKISPDADPRVATPRVRVQLTTKAHAEGTENVDQVYHWQYFARPTGMDPESFTVKYNPGEGGATKHFIYGYRGTTNDYEPITDIHTLGNYEGYAITNDSKNGGVVYQFEGELNPNQNAPIAFKNTGFSLMGNSYLAPVSMEGLFKGIIEGVEPAMSKAPMAGEGGTIEYTIWLYDHDQKRFVQTTSLQAAKSKGKAQLQPMQGFFMRLREGSTKTAAIDYVGAVWNNNAQAGPILAPKQNDNGMNSASIVVSANGCADQIDLFEDAQFDKSFNNGADASKLMNINNMFNLYAQTEAGTLSCVATDNMEGTILTFQANNASEYELSFNGIENMNYSLIDLATGAIVEMNEDNVYKFNAVPNSTEARFQIVVAAQAPTKMDKVINKKAAKGIYSMTGAYLGEAKNFNALPAGVYVVNGERIVK